MWAGTTSSTYPPLDGRAEVPRKGVLYGHGADHRNRSCRLARGAPPLLGADRATVRQGRQGPGSRARAGCRAPGLQAEQRPGRRRRRSQGGGLRPRSPPGPNVRVVGSDGDAALYGARATPCCTGSAEPRRPISSRSACPCTGHSTASTRTRARPRPSCTRPSSGAPPGEAQGPASPNG